MKNSQTNFQLNWLEGKTLSGLLLSSGLLLLVAGWLLGLPAMFDIAEDGNGGEVTVAMQSVKSTTALASIDQKNIVWEHFRNITGSTVSITAGSMLTAATTSTVDFQLNAISPNDEYIPEVILTAPAGWTLTRNAEDASSSSGRTHTVSVSGSGTNSITYTITATGGSGLPGVRTGETWGIDVDVTPSAGALGAANIAYTINGDGFGGGPHTINGNTSVNVAGGVDPNEICVNVFHDYNSDGAISGAGEVGIDGITITAYDASNNASAFTYVSDGNYTFTPGNADTYRVEVTGIPNELEPSVAGATTVFFINRGNKVEVGLHQPAEYFPDDDVFLTVPCYVDGPSNGANSNLDVLIVTSPDELSGGIGNISPTSYYVATHNEIGATFGVAYSRAAETLFAAAFAKRHTAFGPSGTGAIYDIGLTSTVAPITASTPSLFLDLDTYFGANTAGVNTHPDATADFNRDPDTYDAVGKIGLGGLAMSEDENVLWTINLADRRLYEIPLGGTRENPTAPAGAGSISRWPASGDLTDLPGLIGNPAERDQNIRPFAVTCHRGAIYIGLVATGESSVNVNIGTGVITNTGDQTLMRGYIYKFDPATDVFTQILDFPLNYVRGQAIDFCTNNARGEFFPWAPIYDQATMEAAVIGTSGNTNGTDGIEGTPDDLSPERAYPQAWLTDIAFDEQGKIIIGIRDRFADQHGFKKLPPTNLGADPDLLWNADGAGDILVASPNTTDGGATYVLESNSGNGVNGEPFGPTTGMNIQEGPGNGEFFFDDRYRPANATNDGQGQCPGMMPDVNDLDPILDPQNELGHDEISLGGLFVYNGTGNVIVSVYDPINDYDNFNQAGYLSLSTTDGSRQGGGLVYASQDFEGGTVDNINTFGKGNGLGDVEGIAPPAPLQVGNRLWLDGNNNGRQDADEDGINGVLVELFKEVTPGNFTKVAETTTAADALQGNGFFIFSDNSAGDQTWVNGFTEVQAEMDYEIRISLAAVQAVDGTVAAFTTANANGVSTNDSKTDLNDSDASGTGVISFTTGIEGENNHTLDVGVTNSAVCAITVNSATPSVCDPGTNTYSLMVSVTYADAPAGEDIVITTDNGGSQTFTPGGVAGTETFTLTGLTSDGVADIDVTATYVTTTTCTDTEADAYTAPANCTPCSITVNSATASVCDPGTNTYSLMVSVTYADAPAGEDIVITTDNGGSQTFTPGGVAGTETFTLTGLTSDGVADIDVTATYVTTTTCTDTEADAYTAPANCTPCSITVNSATASVCDPGTNTYSLMVSVTYADAPAGEDIVITTDNGGSQTFTTGGVAGTETFTLTSLTSDGVADIDVTANYETTTGCTDTEADAYTAPANCTPCSITVNSATASVCDPGTNTYSLMVSVTYADAPAGEDIVITTDNGGSQTFTPGGVAGTETFTLTSLTSDGVADIDVTATYATTTTCTDTEADAYTAPANCTPCSITVNSATASVCDPGTNTYSLMVSVTYADAPAGEDIVITTDNGGSQTFTPGGVAGTETFTLTSLTSDGVADIDVTANYETTTGCTDTETDAYTAPANCTPCSITVNSATASVCDPGTNSYSLTVNVTYANAPAGEMINVTTDNGGSMSFTPASTAGTEDLVLTGLTSDGMANIDVTATYATTTTCTDTNTDAYTAPDDCTPCAITVNSATASICDPLTNTYSLTVNVTYSDAPAGEMINVTTDNGGSMSFTPASTAGTENLVLTGLTADGMADIDVTATYATTTTCTNTNTDAYSAPVDCTPTCELTITNVDVQCTNGTDFTVSFDVNWDYLLATSDMIEVTIDGDAQPAFTPADVMGSQSFSMVSVTGPGYGLTIEGNFLSNTGCAAAATFDLIACTAACVDGLGGNVFNDIDNDGADAGATDVGEGNVRVEVYDCDNMLVCATWTNANGDWSCPALTDNTEEYRVEFSTPLQDNLTPSFAGTDNGTNTQFVMGGDCDVDYGVLDLSTACGPAVVENNVIGTLSSDGTLLTSGIAIVTCGIIDDPSIPASDQFTLGLIDVRNIVTANNRPETSPVDYHHPDWTVTQVGNVFGTTTDDSGNFYATASSHYGSGFGYTFGGGTHFRPSIIRYGEIGGGANDVAAAGTVYQMDAATGQPTVFAQLPQQSFAFTHIGCEAGVAINRTSGPGLGNIEFDESHDQFFVSNFEDGMIYRLAADGTQIDAFDPQTLAGFAIDDGTAGFANDFKPYGMAVSPDGSRLYFGVHPVDNDGATSLTEANVYYVDLAADGSFSGTEQFVVTTTPDPPGPAFPGDDNAFGMNPAWYSVSDLNFNPDGDLVIGHRSGCGDGTNPIYASSHNHGASYFIYDLGTSTLTNIESRYIGDTGVTANDGSGNDDVYGGIGIWNTHDGNYSYVVSSSDIRDELGPHGLLIFPHDFTQTGDGTTEYILQPAAAIPYFTNFATNDFKGLGGDAEVYSPCGPLPIQIGNYVWQDDTPNGVQEACEPPIIGLPVNLYTKDDNGDLTLVATTMTGPNGEYYFTGDGTTGETWVNTDDVVLKDTTYLIVFGDSPESDTSFVYNNVEYALATDSTGVGTNPNLNDSDGVFTDVNGNNLPAICYNTADTTDHTLDVGLIPVGVFDLALVKRLDLVTSPGPFSPGSTVTFSLEVYNQGDVDANDVEVKDYIPAGLSLAPASAPDWTISVDTAILTAPVDLAAGDSTTLSISFVIDSDFMGDTLTNRAEISSYDDDNNPVTDPREDEDSTPNDNGADDPEVNTPDEYDDDSVDSPGVTDDPTDEDDYDFEGVPVVQTFDLALIKTLDTGATPGPFFLGSTVTFAIKVTNQGSLDATEVEVSDYVPEGLTLVPSPDWTLDVDTARLETPIDLAAGDEVTLSISFTIDNDFMGSRIDNVAEISDFVNALNLPDEDSRPGDNGGDDPEFGSDDEEDDDGPNGNGLPDDPADSDDFDFAPIEIQRFSIGSTVFEDRENNGIMDGSDAGIPNVTVQLYQVVGAKDDAINGETDDVLLDVGSDGDLATATDGQPHVTGTRGDYFFSSLTPGDYYVVIPASEFGPSATLEILNISSTDIGTSTADNQEDGDDNGLQPDGPGMVICSPVINLALGAEPTDAGVNPEDGQGNLQDNAQDANGDMTVDFGLFAPVSVGDTTFVDLDVNGVQSAGDEALPGVIVTLYDSGTMLPVGGNDVNGDPIVPLVTNGMGAYLFDNLPPGDYYVVFDLTNIDNVDLYDFTTPNFGGDDALDSDALPVDPADLMAPSGQTGPLASGDTDLTLDAGIVCAIEVIVANPFTICSTGTVDLLTDASATPASLGAFWTTPEGTGTFVDAAGDPLTAPYALGTAAAYVPSAADALRGYVTLVLSSVDPATLVPSSSCGQVEASVRIDILKVDCGDFLWDGEDD